MSVVNVCNPGTGELLGEFDVTRPDASPADLNLYVPSVSTNLALNKPATVSCQCKANEAAPEAVNGSVSGEWCALGTGKWWRVAGEPGREPGSRQALGRWRGRRPPGTQRISAFRSVPTAPHGRRSPRHAAITPA